MSWGGVPTTAGWGTSNSNSMPSDEDWLAPPSREEVAPAAPAWGIGAAVNTSSAWGSDLTNNQPPLAWGTEPAPAFAPPAWGSDLTNNQPPPAWGTAPAPAFAPAPAPAFAPAPAPAFAPAPAPAFAPAPAPAWGTAPAPAFANIPDFVPAAGSEPIAPGFSDDWVNAPQNAPPAAAWGQQPNPQPITNLPPWGQGQQGDSGSWNAQNNVGPERWGSYQGVPQVQSFTQSDNSSFNQGWNSGTSNSTVWGAGSNVSTGGWVTQSGQVDPTSLAGPNDYNQNRAPVAVKVPYDANTRSNANDLSRAIFERLPHYTIESSTITLLSYEQMKALGSACEVKNDNAEGPNSVNDRCMGVGGFAAQCGTCVLIDCPGHYGLIDFAKISLAANPGHPERAVTMIYNPTVLDTIISVLRLVCNKCSRLLLDKQFIAKHGLDKGPQNTRLTAMAHEAVKQPCTAHHVPLGTPEQQQFCGAEDTCGPNPIYTTYTQVSAKGNISYVKRKWENNTAVAYGNPEVRKPEEVYDILAAITPEDAQTLGFVLTRPVDMILRGLLVMPNVARPPVPEGKRMVPDKLTNFYMQIVRILRQQPVAPGSDDVTLKGNSYMKNIKSVYEVLMAMIYTPPKSNKASNKNNKFKPIIKRIQGKQGDLRDKQQGKRVDYCARSVSAPDCRLRFGQAGLPEIWASVLTKNVKVTRINIDHLTRAMKLGRISLVKSARKNSSYVRSVIRAGGVVLEVGDTVELALEDGDYMIIGRQPTLHNQSMMGFSIVLGGTLTIRLHMSYTTPFNNDFDGDENHADGLRSLEGIVEAMYLLNVVENIVSSEKSSNIMGLVMNAVLGSFLMTDENVRIKEDLYLSLMALIDIKSEGMSTFNDRLMRYGVHPRSGSAVLSALFPSDFYYNNKGVLIMEGIHIRGRWTKGVVGPSSRSIVQELVKQYGNQRAANFLTFAPWIIDKWLMEYGFTVGFRDMIRLVTDPATGAEVDEMADFRRSAVAEAHRQIADLGGFNDDPVEEEYRQMRIMEIVAIAENLGKRIARDMFAVNNSLGIMSDQGSGAKGTLGNIGQIMGAGGQVYREGRRPKLAITNMTRILPSFKPNDIRPEANGFIAESFIEGMTPEGLFFAHYSGREGIINTAVTTARTGHGARSLIKAGEDTTIAYDGSIRNTIDVLLSTSYNSGYDAAAMLSVKNPDGDIYFSPVDIPSMMEEINCSYGWIASDVEEMIYKRRKIVIDEVINLDLDWNSSGSAPPRFNEKLRPTKLKDTTVYPSTYPKQRDFLTKYEKARIIGAGAEQLNNDRPPLVDTDETDPIRISIEEYRANVAPIAVIRRYPGDKHVVIQARGVSII